MFERIKNLFRKGGATLGVINSLGTVLEHPKITMTQDEYKRIQENISFYQSNFPLVEYLNSDNELQHRPYRAINVSKAVARRLAKLVFNEGCTVKVDNDKADEFLKRIFSNNKFRKNFGEELEAGYAIGGLVLRPYYDSGSKSIKIAYCQANSFYPLQSNTNDISEGAIVTVNQEVEGKKTIYYTLIEFHEWINGIYTITNELYRSEDVNKVGVQIPLTELEKYQDLEPRVQLPTVTRPLFVYIKLAGKNNINLSSPLGAGVIDNAKQQLVDINDKYDQFMWEIEKARTKIMASDHFFKTRFNEDGQPVQQFSSHTDIYQKLKTDDPFIDTFAPSLNSTEYIASINFILRIVELQTGFSSGTFSFDGQSVKTATEIISENSETYSTRSDNVLIIEEAMKELVQTIFELADIYDLFNGEVGEISIDFDDGIFISKESQLEYNNKAVVGQLMPRTEAIKRQFGLTDDEAIKWYKIIQAETAGLDVGEIINKNEEKQFGGSE